MTQIQVRDDSTDTKKTDFDAIVIGTGFGGIYSLYKLRNELGLSVRAFDKAGGVGGTWYWNRYPGALSDTESYVYRFSFDKELLQEWEWDTRYLQQPQILAYLGHVVERYDLARDIQFNTGITSIVYDDASSRWTLETDTGETFTARFVVTALGLLSRTNIPNIKGIETFAGEPPGATAQLDYRRRRLQLRIPQESVGGRILVETLRVRGAPNAVIVLAQGLPLDHPQPPLCGCCFRVSE